MEIKIGNSQLGCMQPVASSTETIKKQKELQFLKSIPEILEIYNPGDKGMYILVVDDDPIQLEYVAILLQNMLLSNSLGISSISYKVYPETSLWKLKSEQERYETLNKEFGGFAGDSRFTDSKIEYTCINSNISGNIHTPHELNVLKKSVLMAGMNIRCGTKTAYTINL